jgi:hypothetical protein
VERPQYYRPVGGGDAHLNSLDAPNMYPMTVHFRRGSFFRAGSDDLERISGA